MSLKQQYPLSFLSDDESESGGPTLRINISSQIGLYDSLHPPEYINNIYRTPNINTPQLSESGFLRPKSTHNSFQFDTESSGLNRNRVNPNKRLRFISPHIENSYIPQPVAFVSQADAFAFPVAESTQYSDSPPPQLPDSPTYDYTANTTFFALGNRTTFSLFQQERSAEQQAIINRKVISAIDKLMQEMKVIRRKRARYMKLMKLTSGDNKASVNVQSEP